MSAVGTAFVHATSKRSQKVPHANNGNFFRSLGWIPMIQALFNSYCTPLQYETGMTFFRRVVPELHTVKIVQIF